MPPRIYSMDKSLMYTDTNKVWIGVCENNLRVKIAVQKIEKYTSILAISTISNFRCHIRHLLRPNKVAPVHQGTKPYVATPRINLTSRRRSSGFTTWNAPCRYTLEHVNSKPLFSKGALIAFSNLSIESGINCLWLKKTNLEDFKKILCNTILFIERACAQLTEYVQNWISGIPFSQSHAQHLTCERAYSGYEIETELTRPPVPVPFYCFSRRAWQPRRQKQ